jgi:hypothetical protein
MGGLMSSTINASTASGGGIVTTADASGILQLQTAGVTALSISAAQVVSFTNAVTLTSPTLTTPTIDSAQVPTISGTAPLYMCRAWIYFDGTIATPSIKGSGNISSITDNGTGDYTLNFTTAMPDVNYAYNITNDSGGSNSARYSGTTTISAGSLRFTTRFLSSIGSGPTEDQPYVRVSIFR